MTGAATSTGSVMAASWQDDSEMFIDHHRLNSEGLFDEQEMVWINDPCVIEWEYVNPDEMIFPEDRMARDIQIHIWLLTVEEKSWFRNNMARQVYMRCGKKVYSEAGSLSFQELFDTRHGYSKGHYPRQ